MCKNRICEKINPRKRHFVRTSTKQNRVLLRNVAGVEFREGLDVGELPRGTLLVIDDLMDEVVKSE